MIGSVVAVTLIQALELLDECTSQLAASGCCVDDAIRFMLDCLSLSERVGKFLDDAQYTEMAKVQP